MLFRSIERINANRTIEHDFVFNGQVIEREYNGIYSKYSVDVNGERVKCIEKNDGSRYFEEGETITLFLNSNDIMQF